MAAFRGEPPGVPPRFAIHILPRSGTRPGGVDDGPASGPTSTLRGGTTCGNLQSIHFTPLDGTVKEVEEVAALWPAPLGRHQSLLGRDASEPAFWVSEFGEAGERYAYPPGWDRSFRRRMEPEAGGGFFEAWQDGVKVVQRVFATQLAAWYPGVADARQTRQDD